jgi:hypothetical protein
MFSADAEEEDRANFVTKKVSLPEKLQNKNLVIEINGEGK